MNLKSAPTGEATQARLGEEEPRRHPVHILISPDCENQADCESSPEARITENWPLQYHEKISTVAEAVKAVKSDDRVYIGGGCGEPILLAAGLVRRAPDLRDVEVIHILT